MASGDATMEVFLGMLLRDQQGIGRFAAEEAVKLELDFLGEIESDAPVLRFPQGDRLEIKWGEVLSSLAYGVGRPTALFSAPDSWCMGIRGERGDMKVRLVDVKQRRFTGVAQCLAHLKRTYPCPDTPSTPSSSTTSQT